MILSIATLMFQRSPGIYIDDLSGSQDAIIVELVNQARRSLVIGARLIKDPLIWGCLDATRERGVSVVVVRAKTEPGWITGRFESRWMPAEGFAEVDSRVLWTGGSNWSVGAYLSGPSYIEQLSRMQARTWSDYVSRRR